MIKATDVETIKNAHEAILKSQIYEIPENVLTYLSGISILRTKFWLEKKLLEHETFGG